MEESKYGDGPVGLWQDPDFPPSKESIGELNGDDVPDIVWLRPFVFWEINRQIRAQTSKWYGIYSMAKLAWRTGASQSVLVQCLSERLGRTALHYAIRRGDYSCVQMLLKNGANITIKDSSGTSGKDLCANFTELKDLLRSNNVLSLKQSSLTDKKDLEKDAAPPRYVERLTKTAASEFFG